MMFACKCKVQCGVTGCDHSDPDSCWIMRQELMSSSGNDHRVGAISQQRTLLSISKFRKNKQDTESCIPRVVDVPPVITDYILGCVGETLMSKVLRYTRDTRRVSSGTINMPAEKKTFLAALNHVPRGYPGILIKSSKKKTGFLRTTHRCSELSSSSRV
jgi:hypothetical protein